MMHKSLLCYKQQWGLPLSINPPKAARMPKKPYGLAQDSIRGNKAFADVGSHGLIYASKGSLPIVDSVDVRLGLFSIVVCTVTVWASHSLLVDTPDAPGEGNYGGMLEASDSGKQQPKQCISKKGLNSDSQRKTVCPYCQVITLLLLPSYPLLCSRVTITGMDFMTKTPPLIPWVARNAGECLLIVHPFLLACSSFQHLYCCSNDPVAGRRTSLQCAPTLKLGATLVCMEEYERARPFQILVNILKISASRASFSSKGIINDNMK
eukprot:Gb_21424 [translate_table: standard]